MCFIIPKFLLEPIFSKRKVEYCCSSILSEQSIINKLIY